MKPQREGAGLFVDKLQRYGITSKRQAKRIVRTFSRASRWYADASRLAVQS